MEVKPEDILNELKLLRVDSQTKYNEWKTDKDPMYSQLNQDISQVFTSKRKQKLGKIYEYLYENELIDNKIYKLEEKIKNLRNVEGKRVKTLHYWVTINPPETTSLKDMLQTTERFVNRVIIDEYMYVVEQRGGTSEECGRGKHIHMYYKIDEERYQVPSKQIKLLKNTYKNLLNVETKALWIQPLKEEYIKDKINYMKDTNKYGEGKDVKQEIDKIFRKDNNLEAYYTNLPIEHSILN